MTELGHFCSNICDLETRDCGRLSKCVNHSDRVIFGTFFKLSRLTAKSIFFILHQNALDHPVVELELTTSYV